LDITSRKFIREFKIKAVRLVTVRGAAVAQAACNLDVADSVLRRWMRELTGTESVQVHLDSQTAHERAARR
jgi:transposase